MRHAPAGLPPLPGRADRHAAHRTERLDPRERAREGGLGSDEIHVGQVLLQTLPGFLRGHPRALLVTQRAVPVGAHQ